MIAEAESWWSTVCWLNITGTVVSLSAAAGGSAPGRANRTNGTVTVTAQAWAREYTRVGLPVQCQFQWDPAPSESASSGWAASVTVAAIT